MTRWDRIALVRDLSSAAAKDGDTNLGNRFARAQRQSHIELHQHLLAQAQAVFANQVRASPGATSPAPFWPLRRVLAGTGTC